MSRGKKAVYNSIASMIGQGVSIICGFILPRLVLSNFGSTYNGLIQSVTQFLSVVALLRAGVGGATRATLYKTLANKDNKQLSATIRATELFMRKIAFIFAGFVVAFSCIYPLKFLNDFEWLFSATLVLIISASTFIEYYFGITYHILLQADQRQYISSLLGVGTTVLNTLLAVILINNGFGIHVVKLGSTIAYCITPIILHFYAKKHYHIDQNASPDFTSIKQRWDALFHQIAGFVYSNTDIMLITLFLDLNEVSVYTVYCMVSNGLKMLMSTVTTGVEAAFGDMIARGNRTVLIENIKVYETLLHGVLSVLFGVALILITPFVQIYTRGVTDVNYTRYAFGYLLIVTEAMHLLRQPYQSIIEAAGQFKQTKRIPMIQAAMNLTVSIVLINFFGLIGVIIGTLVSDLYSDIAYRVYAKKNILQEIKYIDYVKRVAVTALTMFCIYGLSMVFKPVGVKDYFTWIIYAVPVALTAIVIMVGLGCCFYPHEMRVTCTKLKRIIGGIIKKEKK